MHSFDYRLEQNINSCIGLVIGWVSQEIVPVPVIAFVVIIVGLEECRSLHLLENRLDRDGNLYEMV